MNQDLDLNLLIVLVLMNEYRHLKPVAKALGKTESAVSKNLTKLREQLDDPLFVRGASDFEPTDYLLNIIPTIASSLGSIKSIVASQQFDPRVYNKDIVIAIPSSIQYRIGSRLMIDLFMCFPKAKIDLVDWDDSSKNAIFEGRVDVGVHYFNCELPKSIYQHKIGRLTSAIVTRKDVDVSNFDDLLKMPFILLTTKGRGDREGESKLRLERQGTDIDIRGVVDNVTCLLTAIKELNFATILHNLGDSIDGFNITPFPNSLELEELPKIVVNYRVANRGNPLHEFLVNRIQYHLMK